ncbi:MAG: phosphatidylglycerol lysyltransferase domain-containing protein [Desulfobacterota bacterium]|nr:phosphatidylglycerol lysyltransferase domain-containing protein [Thermodesulfobacteriota bacterium]MDW8002646.1 phosphatidylglycerol lysyltransferase domain-containing protein [Deltaproteobacteria bacterium]
MVPVFPNFKEITIDDRVHIERIIRAYRPTTSEWTFTNLFMWRKYYGLRWAVVDETLFCVCEADPKRVYGFQPIGVRDRKTLFAFIEWLKRKTSSKKAIIERADMRFVKEILGTQNVSVFPQRDHFDYVYSRDDLAYLRGKRYRIPRNHINRLLRIYPLEFQILERDHMEGCIEVHRRWVEKKKDPKDKSLVAEFEAVCELFDNYEKLNLIGGVILLGKKVVAFSIGEMLNDTTMVVHVEKADPEYPGLFSLINQKFSEICAKDAIYINREQDLGIPGLRRAKISYHPHHLEEKFRIEIE